MAERLELLACFVTAFLLESGGGTALPSFEGFESELEMKRGERPVLAFVSGTEVCICVACIVIGRGWTKEQKDMTLASNKVACVEAQMTQDLLCRGVGGVAKVDDRLVDE